MTREEENARLEKCFRTFRKFALALTRIPHRSGETASPRVDDQDAIDAIIAKSADEVILDQPLNG